MAPTPIDVTSTKGWQTIEAYLPEDFEVLAKKQKVLEVQYGAARITSARDLLRLILPACRSRSRAAADGELDGGERGMQRQPRHAAQEDATGGSVFEGPGDAV